MEKIPFETRIRLDRFKLRPYQEPIWDALENKGYKRLLVILPRRSGKDICCLNLLLRQALKKVGIYYYLLPTYSQARKTIWDSLTNTGVRFMDYIPKELISNINSTEMKVRLVNDSLIQFLGSDNFDCFDDQTEILTENGWKLFMYLERDEKVATLKDGYLEYEVPTRHVQYLYDSKYDGYMYACSNSSMNFKVTANHRFWVKSGKGVYKFKRIDDRTIQGDSIPSTCLWRGKDRDYFVFPEIVSSWICGKGREVTKEYRRVMPMKDFMAFLGIYLAEGSTYHDEKTYRVVISQSKEHVKREIFELLKRNNINYCYSNGNIAIEDKQLWSYFFQFGKQDMRFIPKDIKELAPEYLTILFDWLVKGDGYTCKEYTAYYSISKKLVDDVQELIIKLGLSGNVHVKNTYQQSAAYIKGRRIESKHILYEVRVRKSKFKRFGSSKKFYIHTKPYKGTIYCVSVPSGVIKVRRKGKECWSGNSLVGTNPSGCIFSEYALQDPRAYQFLRPALTATGGFAIFISTPRGKNHLWEMWNIATQNPNDWFAYKLTVEDTMHIPLHEIQRELNSGEMSEDLVQQEYYCSWEHGIEGSYYGKYLDRLRLKGQISVVPYETGFKVHTAWDLGVRDSTSIILFQTIGQIVRLIDFYENSKVGLEHYIEILEQKRKENGWIYGKHIAPHDIRQREFTSGISRIEMAKRMGITFTISNEIEVADGIEAVRAAFSKIWIDEKNCSILIKHLENYRQEYDAKKKVYKPYPLHDNHSHAADAMRYLCCSLPKTRDDLSPEELEKRYQEAVYGNQSGLPDMFKDDYKIY